MARMGRQNRLRRFDRFEGSAGLRFSLILLLGTILFSCAEAGVRLGSDRISEEPYRSWFQNKRVGLITNQTGVDSSLVLTMDKLRTAPDVKLTALFGPEHGLLGQAQAGEKVSSGPQAFSLYGENRAPTDEMLQDVDLLVYDIQDVGVRFYTFTSTMFESMKAAARKGIPFVVLDRPNPIGGIMVEGPVLEAGHESFVGIYRLPIRYGMTIGELARFLAGETGLQLDLRIIPMEGWDRAEWYEATGLAWVFPSPNMPTIDTAVVYPGFCLVEGTNLSEGRGTTKPFELFGAPWLNAPQLATRMNNLQLPGVRFRVQSFTPTFSKHAGESCSGLQLHVTDRNSFSPVRTILHLLREVRLMHPEEFSFIERSFDRLAGNSWIREMLAEGREVEEIEARWQPELQEFLKRRAEYLLY